MIMLLGMGRGWVGQSSFPVGSFTVQKKTGRGSITGLPPTVPCLPDAGAASDLQASRVGLPIIKAEHGLGPASALAFVPAPVCVTLPGSDADVVGLSIATGHP